MKSQTCHVCIAKETPPNGPLNSYTKKANSSLYKTMGVPCLSLAVLIEGGTSTAGQLMWPERLEGCAAVI